jgi:hypothetical protein
MMAKKYEKLVGVKLARDMHRDLARIAAEHDWTLSHAARRCIAQVIADGGIR